VALAAGPWPNGRLPLGDAARYKPAMLALLPSGVSPGFALLIVVASAFTSALTGAFGLGGGVALLALMAQGLPVPALIPVHGVAQLGSNLGRAIVQRAFVDWPTVRWFSVGSLAGAALGALTVVTLPEPVLKVALAGFVVWAALGRKPRLSARGSAGLMAAGGVVATFASMFFGATGPITAAFLATRGLVKTGLVATHAAAMVLQHGFKIGAFGALGFSYLEWLPLLAAIVAAGFLGTLFGSKLLREMPDRWFEAGFKVVMVLLAAELAYEGITGLLATDPAP
jgi:uncharacterized membrane protein YfcA